MLPERGARSGVILLLVFLMAGVLAGCDGPKDLDLASGDTEGRKDKEASSVAAPAATLPEATVGAVAEASGTSRAALLPRPAADGPPFHARPTEAGGSGSEADDLLTVRYGTHEGYERVVLDLGIGREPARTVPGWNVESPPGDGLLRVGLPSVNATAVSDGRLGGALLKDFHVVRGPEGGMFVDFLAREGFTYRVLELPDPARVVVDFKPVGAPLGMPLPAEGGDTVLVEPRRGDRVEGPVTVRGYSRNFEAANTITLTDAAGKRISSRTVRGNDWSSTWGYFEATLDVPAFSGQATLRAGTLSARDGSFRGVEIPVRGG